MKEELENALERMNAAQLYLDATKENMRDANSAMNDLTEIIQKLLNPENV